MAGTTGLEPAASAVTGQRSNQLNYVPTRQINEMRNNQCLCGFAQIAYRALIASPCLQERCFRRNRPQTANKFLAGLPHCPGRFAPIAKKKTRKTSRKHLNSFSFTAKGRPASFTRLGFYDATVLRSCTPKARLEDRREHYACFSSLISSGIPSAKPHSVASL